MNCSFVSIPGCKAVIALPPRLEPPVPITIKTSNRDRISSATETKFAMSSDRAGSVSIGDAPLTLLLRRSFVALPAASIIGASLVFLTFYGVNYVFGKGLHTYGFGEGSQTAMFGFFALEAMIIAAATMVHMVNKAKVAETPKD